MKRKRELDSQMTNYNTTTTQIYKTVIYLFKDLSAILLVTLKPSGNGDTHKHIVLRKYLLIFRRQHADTAFC